MTKNDLLSRGISSTVASNISVKFTNYYTKSETEVITNGLSSYITNLETNTSTKYALKSEVTNSLSPKGTLSYSELPKINNSIGDFYYCQDGDGINGAGNYTWNGTIWYFGGTGSDGVVFIENQTVNMGKLDSIIQDDIGLWINQNIIINNNSTNNPIIPDGYDPISGELSTEMDYRGCYWETLANEGDRFKIYGFTFGGGSTYCVYFVNSNNKIISKFGEGLSWGIHNIEITCPKSTSKIKMNAWNTNGNRYVEKLTYQPIATQNYTDDKIRNHTFEVPTFYEEHIIEKISTINYLENEYGSDGETIAFITDMHYPANSMYSLNLLKKIYERTNLRLVINGGDNILDNIDINVAKNRKYEFNELVNRSLGDKFIRIYGNHDNNSNQLETLTKEEVYSIDAKGQELIVNPNINNLNGMYWYIDNPIQKIRYIGLNLFEGEEGVLSVSQMKWLCEKALIFPSVGWSVAFFTHRTTSPLRTGELTEFRGIIRAIRYKSSYATEYIDYNDETYNINVNYSTINASVLFCANGHIHYDLLDIDNGIGYFASTCDATYKDNESVPNRIVGTTTVQSFDIIVINKKTNTINLVKIGAGENRNFSFINNK